MSHRQSVILQDRLSVRPVSVTISFTQESQVNQEKPFSRSFFDKNNTAARKIYFKVFFGGCFLIVLLVFAVFSIFWGSLWKSPARNFKGWVVDFDGGPIGQAVVQGLAATSATSKITWNNVSASQFPNGLHQLGEEIIGEKAWVAVVINQGASDRLMASYSTPNATYNGSEAITVYASEARNENAFRNFIRPLSQTSLEAIAQSFAVQAPRLLMPSTTNLTLLLATSPQTLTAPISYTLNNLAPFSIPVASAITFIGLILVLILSFFVVNISNGARNAAGLNQHLTLRSLIITRFVSAFGSYFMLSLFYSLLTQAFQLDFSHRFGKGGFVLFWMLNWAGMLAVGLALEALVPLLANFLAFFMALWIIVNVSVCILPIEVLPIVYHYGYATPFYNVSHAVRCIVFGTRNTVGQNFGVLAVWIAISCITMPLIQWFVRRKDVIAERQNAELEDVKLPKEKEPADNLKRESFMVFE